jgi:deoxyadenosine/deoxycytidine kinase
MTLSQSSEKRECLDIWILYYEGPPGVGKSYQMRLGEAQPHKFFDMMTHISPDFAARVPIENECAVIFASEVPENWTRNKSLRGKSESLFLQAAADPHSHMAEFQAKVLMERFEETKNALREALEKRDETKYKQVIIVCERSLYVDRLVFAQAAREKGFFTDVQWADYESLWFKEVGEFQLKLIKFCADDYDLDARVGSFGTVLMKSEPEECLIRIRSRRRRGEENLDIDYCREMKNRHDKVLADPTYPARPVYVVDESKLVFTPDSVVATATKN